MNYSWQNPPKLCSLFFFVPSHFVFLMEPAAIVNVWKICFVCTPSNPAALLVSHLHWSALHNEAVPLTVVCMEEVVMMGKQSVGKVRTQHYNAVSQWWDWRKPRELLFFMAQWLVVIGWVSLLHLPLNLTEQ